MELREFDLFCKHNLSHRFHRHCTRCVLFSCHNDFGGKLRLTGKESGFFFACRKKYSIKSILFLCPGRTCIFIFNLSIISTLLLHSCTDLHSANLEAINFPKTHSTRLKIKIIHQREIKLTVRCSSVRWYRTKSNKCPITTCKSLPQKMSCVMDK